MRAILIRHADWRTQFRIRTDRNAMEGTKMRTQGLSLLVILVATLLNGCCSCCGSKTCRLSPGGQAAAERPATYAAAPNGRPVSHAEYYKSAAGEAQADYEAP